MDLLSDVIEVMRTGEPRSAVVAWQAPWAQAFNPVPGAAGFQVILHGSCWLIRPDADPLQLGIGDVVFLPHGQGHVLADSPATPVTSEACDPNDPAFAERHVNLRAPAHTGTQQTITLCGAYELDPARVHPMLLSLPETIHLPARLGDRQDLHAAVTLLGAELQRPRLGSDALIPALLDTLLLYILRAWFEQQPADTTTGWAAALNDSSITAALHAIHRDPARPWTVATLATEAGLSRAAFARRFTTLVGQPPLGYLTWWRMTMAGRLLRDTDGPLSAIAGKVGYRSEFAFANAFKRHHGTAPGRYRRVSRP
ncbi:MAG: AraC family transcriptional regulator [Kibdelosporangium sp.]